ncbi:Tn7 transposase TnsA N-terminal domain-containing protein [Aliarcobacter cryaerophilus]|uniref:TnsA endonuclease N-terminal domain-containing protein n=2 Tax=unclassified Arcobacter TaxID=2593671 RepID=A0AA96I4T5_9BACT|nr:TnsA endonuclease N-terminal domain-containing protein [Arcobacter sp. AZ-2023]WPD09054.1 TnsA endonuclease N-terminal domain-containing protein [Arcobacter sp. DSM 115954]WNL13886.1 TnsA endonuclease N-terminal domain-containing protein [Arcobacter sp. AZ-2023]WNL18108.1 TnsA endonuclease N-terminal domain-containing protein [Arcobacter sp. AZ-2023]WNL20243.1 TnsA endonuclease N-terminal domain-containing protein [Arcobacter sp. AZ-2023]
MEDSSIKFSQRKIKKNYRSITGHFPSIKNNTSIGFESKLEKAHFLSLEFDNEVISYQEQPQVEISINGNDKIYSADCYIKRDKTSLKNDSIVEVKYTNEIEKRKEYFEKKFESAKTSVNKLNLDFEVYTEKIHSEIYLDNLDFLYRYKLQPIENKYENQILKMVNKNHKISAFDLANLISKNPIEYALISNCIWDLVCKEKLKTNLELSKITMNSLVELSYE